jgi:glycosyltransferase involved in cell wall biosynthesis
MLQKAGHNVLLITGDAPKESLELPIAIVPSLHYDNFRTTEDSPESLANAIRTAMENHWGTVGDVLHIHNPLIRKNKLLLPAIIILQEEGIPILLQNHDFAEDFRPDVYIKDHNYPEKCHYGAINHRDFSFLHRAGCKSEGLHLLPNGISPYHSTPKEIERRRYLYPVRAIRRKNIGEALLLSLFIPQGKTVAITLPPTSERDTPIYTHWKQVAHDLQLPIEFETGLHESFSDLLGSAYCVITTSVKEGFEFSFIEPWTAGKAVLGRRIDYVCQDFEEAGVTFDTLYSSIDIPLVYLSPPILRKKLEQAIITSYQAFQLDVAPYTLKKITDDLFSRDVFDFGRLDEELQTNILYMLASNPAACQDVVELNPFIAQLESWKPNEEIINQNRKVVLQAYGEERISKNLLDTYQKVQNNIVHHTLSRSVLLDLFLDPFKISLIGIGYE